MFELVNFFTCVEVMYLRICNISLRFMLRLSVLLFPFYRIESLHEETFRNVHWRKPWQKLAEWLLMCLHNGRYIFTDNLLFVWWDSKLVPISVIMILVHLSMLNLLHVTFLLSVKVSRYWLICYLVVMFWPQSFHCIGWGAVLSAECKISVCCLLAWGSPLGD